MTSVVRLSGEISPSCEVVCCEERLLLKNCVILGSSSSMRSPPLFAPKLAIKSLVLTPCSFANCRIDFLAIVCVYSPKIVDSQCYKQFAGIRQNRCLDSKQAAHIHCAPSANPNACLYGECEHLHSSSQELVPLLESSSVC